MNTTKAEQIAREAISKWTLSDAFNDFDRRNNVEPIAEYKLLAIITDALIQYSTEQNKELVEALEVEKAGRVRYWEAALVQKSLMREGVDAMNECVARLNQFYAIVNEAAQEECYCADNVAVKGPCLSCKAAALLAQHSEKGEK